jgi:two-component system, oxyanion-binding sensor
MLNTLSHKSLIVGFIPLLDCATLVAAVEKGFAAAEGLNVALVRESSWANIRDRIIVGHFDAAHMLGPMPVASTLGIGHLKVPMIAPYSMGLGGNAITASNGLWKQMKEHGAAPGADPAVQCAALAKVINERALQGLPPLTLGMVYPFSCHNYELRYWLAAGGIDPDRDVRLVVIPPPLLVDALRAGQVDGFCVGEPWNSLAVAAGVGCIVTPTSAIWHLSPEKVIGCRADWAERNSERLGALIRALYHASQWCERAENHAELAAILSEPRYVGVAAEILRLGLSGDLLLEPHLSPVPTRDFLVFARHHATFPWVHHAAWFYSQMVRWRQIEPSAEGELAACNTYRPDVYRSALLSLRVPEVERQFEISQTGAYRTGAYQAGGFFDQTQAAIA